MWRLVHVHHSEYRQSVPVGPWVAGQLRQRERMGRQVVTVEGFDRNRNKVNQLHRRADGERPPLIFINCWQCAPILECKMLLTGLRYSHSADPRAHFIGLTSRPSR
jgi:hypothetical protein